MNKVVPLYRRLHQFRLGSIALICCFLFSFYHHATGQKIHQKTNEKLRIASYNVENYLLMNRRLNGHWRQNYPKPEAEKLALRQIIRHYHPDILALQEMGEEQFLIELQSDLRDEGLHYPYRIWMASNDGVRHLAMLSKIAPAETHFHNHLDLPYRGERSLLRRGMLEVVFTTDKSNPQTWHLFVFHLKSKWTEHQDDQEANLFRTREAEAARNFIIEKLPPEKGNWYLITGDLNDDPNSAPIRRFLTRGDKTIGIALPTADDRGHLWTHFWSQNSRYSIKDYFIASPSLYMQVIEGKGHISSHPSGKNASDHRLIYLDLQFNN